jgi:hypothetical protein
MTTTLALLGHCRVGPLNFTVLLSPAATAILRKLIVQPYNIHDRQEA